MVRHFALDAQSTLSYLLLVGETVEDLLRDLDEKIASPQFSMRAKKLTKLLPPTSICMKKYYMFEGNTTPQFLPENYRA